jgi:hypothetical protein
MDIFQVLNTFFTSSVNKFIAANAVCALCFTVALNNAEAQKLDEITHESLSSHIVNAESQVVSFASAAKQRNAQFRNENLTLYLILYTSLVGCILSWIFASVSYRFSDQNSPYKVVRQKTSLLTAACGLGLGIFIATLEVPSNHPARLTILLCTITTGVLVMWSIAQLGFIFLRSLTLREANLKGRAYSERIRQG